jgi:hypothetical protein
LFLGFCGLKDIAKTYYKNQRSFPTLGAKRLQVFEGIRVCLDLQEKQEK